MATAFISGYSVDTDTSVSRQSNVRKTALDGGGFKYVVVASETAQQINAMIKGMTESEMNTLIDWLETNETTEIDLTIGSYVYRGHIDPMRAIRTGTMRGAAQLWQLSFGFDGVRL